MPFDLPPSPLPRISALRRAGPGLMSLEMRPGSTRAVAVWLFVLAGMILVMVSLGGATRLTGSGLSIMEWAPIMGTLPPLSEAEWNRLYALYQHIPQYDLVNQGFGLAGFKGIFWLEWTHRLWGRLMGAVLFVPLVWFAVRGRIDRRLAVRLGVLFLLGALQGLVGWFMVASGFEADRTAVSPYRLVVHLALAVTLYSAVLWTALGELRGGGRQGGEPAPTDRTLRRLAHATAGMVFVTILAGGFVAGLKAGLTYNTFPLMDGRLVPEGYAALGPWWRNLFENVAAVQFDHRVIATVTALLALATVAYGVRRVRGAARGAVLALGAAVATQYTLGVLTLLYAVPVALGVLHQATAMLVLTAALLVLHSQRRAGVRVAALRSQ